MKCYEMLELNKKSPSKNTRSRVNIGNSIFKSAFIQIFNSHLSGFCLHYQLIFNTSYKINKADIALDMALQRETAVPISTTSLITS